jgi:carotenoid cleavage dioxygenase
MPCPSTHLLLVSADDHDSGIAAQAAGDSMTAVHPGTAHPGTVDAASNPHLSGVFAPVVEEVDLSDLRVEGRLPEEMDGTYLRNGPNPRFTPVGSYLYPLDGDAMMHRVRVRDGKADYSNRFVRTPALVTEEKAGRALWGGIMDPPPDADTVGPQLAGTRRDLPDINVVRHGGKLLALAESDNPFCLGTDLQTLGRETFAGDLPVGITAHPKIDPVTGEMVVFCYQLEAPYLTWSVLDRQGAVTRPATEVAGVDRPSMVHDMAITPTYIVLVLAPLFFDMAALLRGGSPLSWEPERGTRVALIPRDGGPVRWTGSDGFWMWHAANAYEVPPAGGEGGVSQVVLDYVEWSTPGMGVAADPVGGIARALIDPSSGQMTRSRLDDRPVEFPRIDDRLIGHQHSTIAVGAKTGRHDLAAGAYDAVRWYEPGTADSVEWHGGSLVLGEPAFVPRPGDPEPRHGWWVTFAIDLVDQSSWFLVFAAGAPEDGPVARVSIPVRVPLGLHGNWLPAEE